ncbi:TPA: GyrI-like domain-containing protein [Staphylococcus aureus]|uniref:GyrI-like domain-containing protein n=1 Tax=Staphylococcus aureus TaxID=1280 RepID=UPI00346466DA
MRENGYRRYVKTNKILGVALDNPQIVEEESCRYDLVLKIDEDVKTNDLINSRSFTGGKYAVFVIPHTTKDVKDFYSNLSNVIDRIQLRVKNEPVLESYKEEEGKDKCCEILIPVL